jgi:hypothetical protein
MLGGADRSSGGAQAVFLGLFRIVLVISAGAIVLLRWYFVDMSESYMAGYPAPRTYIARSFTRFVDKTATSELRNMASDQIVNVRVRNYGSTQFVVQRISALKNDGNFDFAPPELASVIRALPDADRARIISTAVDIAEKNYDRFTNKSEQTSMIWDNLRYIDIPQANKNVIFQLLDASRMKMKLAPAATAHRIKPTAIIDVMP